MFPRGRALSPPLLLHWLEPGPNRPVHPVVQNMVDCSLELSCRDQDSWINGPWSSLSVQVCASGLKCGNTAYILINSTVICLTGTDMRNIYAHKPFMDIFGPVVSLV